MQIFKYLFRNFFNDPRITDERLRNYTADHISRLEKHNTSGAFSLVIADTQAAYNAYFNASLDSIASQVAADNLEELIWQFKVNVTEKETLIRNLFRKGSAAYNNFYPRGLAEYTKAPKDRIGQLMTRFATVAAAHKKDLGEPVAGIFTGISAQFQQASKNKPATDVATKQALTYRRAPLEQQLCRNLHYIAYYFAGEVEKCYALIDQSLLRLRLSDEPEVFTGVIFFGATINVISMGITHYTVFRVRNIGQVPLRCCLAENADSVCTDIFCEVPPQQEIVIPADQLGDPAEARFFNISNLSDEVGRYEVLMED